MAPKIFITGVTGYIGGDALHALSLKHPDYEYAALIRTQDKADAVTKAYPKLRPVLGGLDDFDVIKKEAANADVVIHTADASDHEGAAKAIVAGLESGHSKERPGYYLHTGGTGILTYDDSSQGKLGDWTDKEYNDWAGVDELTHLPDAAFHRNVDKIVLESGTKYADSVKTIIVCPPTIYGTGRGPTNRRSRQAYELAKFILTKHWVPVIGHGKARWNNVHVHDLSEAFTLLTEAGVAGNTTPELWGAKGYAIVEAGEHSWTDVAERMGEEAHRRGYLEKKPEVNALSAEEAEREAGFQALSWGLNSRAKAERLGRVLGWKATGQSLREEIPEIVRGEYERLRKSG